VFFNSKYVPKFGDFGIANFKLKGAGTVCYFAPEQHCDDLSFSEDKVDYWGLGILIFTLVKRRLP